MPIVVVYGPFILCPHAAHNPPDPAELPLEEDEEGTTEVCSTVGLSPLGDAADDAAESDSVLPEDTPVLVEDFRLPFCLLPEAEALEF